MGRLKKEILEKNKIDYRDIIQPIIDRLTMYWIQIKKTSSLNITIPDKKILLYFPFIPKALKNPEIYIIIREDEKFTYLMSKLFGSENVQIFIIHNSYIEDFKEIGKSVSATFPIPFADTYKSPIIAIECPDSMKENYLFKNILLKDKQLNSYITSQLKYF